MADPSKHQHHQPHGKNSAADKGASCNGTPTSTMTTIDCDGGKFQLSAKGVIEF